MSILLQQLSKDPSDYSDAKSLPHVLIAVRYNAHSTGRKMKRGDTIAYIVCEVSYSFQRSVPCRTSFLFRMEHKIPPCNEVIYAKKFFRRHHPS